MKAERTVIVFTDWFWPGYKAGGPITSLVNLVNAIKDVDFRIITSDRDLHAERPYEGISPDEWTDYGPNVKVIYLSPEKLSKQSIGDLLQETDADYIYLNSMFSRHFTLIPLSIIRRVKHRGRVILAPRGMLKSGALSVKPWKKKIFLALAGWTGLYRDIEWHATSPEEVIEIRGFAGNKPVIHLAPNIPTTKADSISVSKVPGELRVLTVSRVSPEKGIEEAIGILENPALRGFRITWTIAGAIPDSDYARACVDRKSQSENLEIIWLGEVPPGEISSLMSSHHILLSATRGENFGHAIIESLSSGRPVVISDRTPWRELSDCQAGFDVPADEPARFTEALAFFAQMDQDVYNIWSEGARKFASSRLGEQDGVGATRKLFGLS